jgi:Co/Zn/Cd efflux system component
VSSATESPEHRSYRLTIIAIAASVLAICASETLYGLALDSRFLIRDGLEWGYDVAIYVLAAATFGHGPTAERRAALGVALVLLFAGGMTSFQIWRTFSDPPQVEAFSITLSGTLIILEAFAVAGALWRFRRSDNPVIVATWLSARNDVASSTLYALVMMGARFTPMRWPQMGVDAVTVFLCWQAAWRILSDLRKPVLKQQ